MMATQNIRKLYLYGGLNKASTKLAQRYLSSDCNKFKVFHWYV